MDNKTFDLQRKLGLKPNQKTYTLYAPSGYDKLLPYPAPLISLGIVNAPIDWLQVFYKDKSLLEQEIRFIKKSLSVNGQLWICWPKKSSKLKSDLSDSSVRDIGLAVGLVDVKVASINDTWSGLKFVYRLKDR